MGLIISRSLIIEMRCYSLAVLHCLQIIDWRIQLSIVYANRSACLYYLKNCDLTIPDIQQALDYEYLKDLQYKVFDRYWFEYKCIDCCQDWTIFEQIETSKSFRMRYIHYKNAITAIPETIIFAVHCMVCSKFTERCLKALKGIENKYLVANQFMDKHNYEKALSEFIQLLS